MHIKIIKLSGYELDELSNFFILLKWPLILLQNPGRAMCALKSLPPLVQVRYVRILRFANLSSFRKNFARPYVILMRVDGKIRMDSKLKNRTKIIRATPSLCNNMWWIWDYVCIFLVIVYGLRVSQIKRDDFEVRYLGQPLLNHFEILNEESEDV